MKISKEIDHKGGVEASSISQNIHSNRPVYIIYEDHIRFRKSIPELYGRPNIREAIGWIIAVKEKTIIIISDKSLTDLPYEKIDLADGLTILKNTILEIREIG